MKAKKSFILILGLVVIGIIFWVFVKGDSKFFSPDKNIVVRVYGNSEGLVCLEIFDKKRQEKELKITISSIYQRYKITFLGNENFLFNSSDTGSVLFKYDKKRWIGMNIYAFPSPVNESIVILLPKEEKMKLEKNLTTDEVRENRLGANNECELLVFSEEMSIPLFTGKWYDFSTEAPPHKAIEWHDSGNFTLKDQHGSTTFRVDDEAIIEKK